MAVLDAKFSTFANGGDLVATDIVVGLRDGVNTRFTYDGAGVITLTGTANEVDVGGTASAPIVSLSPTIDTPGTFTIQTSVVLNDIIDDDSMATATDNNISTSEATKAYIDAQVLGASPLTTKGDLYTYTTLNARLAVGTVNGQIVQVDSATTTGLAWSTAAYPSTAASAGTIIRADGTNWVASTSTFANTYAINSFLFASAANAITALAPANRAVMTSGATGVPVMTALATDGQLIIGSTAGAPAAATLTAGAGISIANASNAITISVAGGGLAVVTIAGTSQAAAVNTMYIALNAGQTTVTLPAVCAVGETVSVVGSGANTGGWIIQLPAADTAMYNGTATTAAGTLTSSAAAGQTIELVCDVANTSWVVVDTVNITLTTA